VFAPVRRAHLHPKSYVLDIAAYVEGDGLPPPELEAALLSETYGPPWEGGFMTWPARPFLLMRFGRNAFHAYNGYRHAPDKVAWIDQNPDAWDVAELVLGIREGLL